MLLGRDLAPHQLENVVALYMLRNCCHSSSIVVDVPSRCARSYGVTLTARTIQSSPTSRTLTQAGDCSRLPRNDAPAGERAGEDRAVDAAVEDREHDVPVVRREQPVDRGQNAVEERADRLAGEEAGVLGNDAAKGVGERALELVLGDVGEAAGLELAQVRPGLGLEVRRDDASRSPPCAAGRS